MNINLGLTHINAKLTRSVATTGAHPLPTSRGDKYASPNLIYFPAHIPPAPANSELRSRAPLSLSDDACAFRAMSIVIVGFLAAISLLLFAGFEIFDLFDLG